MHYFRFDDCPTRWEGFHTQRANRNRKTQRERYGDAHGCDIPGKKKRETPPGVPRDPHF